MGTFVGVSSIPRCSGTPVRESAAPPPGTSVRVLQIGPRIASKSILDRHVTQPLTLSVSQERTEFRSITAINYDLSVGGNLSQRQIAKSSSDVRRDAIKDI